jgi:hypothetical protein
MEEGTGEAEVFTEAAGAGFMAGEAAFTEEDSPAEGILVSAADTRLAGIAAAGIGAADFMGDAATTVVAAMDGVAEVTAGVAEVGVMVVMGLEEAGVGAGDLASDGRIGDGDIRMDITATARGITRPTLIIIPTRPTALRKTT